LAGFSVLREASFFHVGFRLDKSSKELCAKLRNVSTNRKKAFALSPVFKRVLQIQRLLVLAAKNLLIQNKMKGRV
jgi:hypothetical protein